MIRRFEQIIRTLQSKLLLANAVRQATGLPIGGFGTPMQSDRGTLRILAARIRQGFDVQ